MNTAEIRQQTKTEIKGKHFKAGLIFLIYTLFVTIACIIPFIGSIFILVLSCPLAYGVISSIIKLKRDEEVGYFDFVKIAFSEFSNAWRVAFSILGKVWPYFVGYFVSMIFIAISIGTAAFSIALGLTGYGDASIGAGGATLIFMIIGGIGCLVFGILLTLKTLYYSLSNYILYDNTSLKGKEIVEKSYELMNGHRWHLIKMQIPYYLLYYLAALAIGIVAGILGISSEDNSFIVSLLSLIPMVYFMPLIQFSILNFYEKLKGNEQQEEN